MNKKDFLSAMGDIDDRFIEEAENYSRSDAKKWLKYGGLAACLLICALCFSLFGGNPESNKEANREKVTVSDLPVLTIERRYASNDTRERRVSAASGLEDGNPWSEDVEIDTLPVYENTTFDQNDTPASVSDGELETYINDIAESAEMNVESIRYSRKKEEKNLDKSFKAKAETAEGTITVYSSHLAIVEYSESLTLPEEYRVPTSVMTKEQAQKVTDYLLEEYGEVMGFENAKGTVQVEYDEQDNARWYLMGYESAEDQKEEVLNYNLKRINFVLNQEGDLEAIVMVDNMACGREIEEYPLITTEKAEEMLRENYEGKFTEESQIENIRLIYLAGEEYSLFLPYYAFDVRASEGGDSGEGNLVNYETYYVLAIPEQYVVELPKN